METTAAFQAGAGFASDTLFVVVAGTGCTAAFLWAMWAALSAYKGWSKERVDGDVFGLAVLRVVLLVVMFIWLFL
ncbi:hypothetical protein L861_06530 [Litchfieldella anticariensis FP35 = DSM 16096]|uniref:Integrating conjugative element protein n=1 Tax=Litchfieldella anticariensis (strain DSM 16096 / CECT 5854 / CIP 108499 / LMG 22089 / FP35) TaxID=1121939 RepID=S2KF99_LITA3|nr:TIGR03758 family integrating conjugative element protein [Halomonas anticariensis]EPC00590.1 hypothetical protein L861_06530 [Halomonas anticariensis FP35 = DSM 16096]